jgi:UDP:flavonoid glycosyltransferase YjiC (YdhE family)
MLLAGKPLLLLPIFLEQQILAERIVGLGVAVSAASERAKEVVSGLEQLIGNKMLGAYAAGFGKRHDDFDAARKTEEMASLIEG